MVFGAFVIVCALVSNEWVLEYLFSPDRLLDASTRHTIRILMAVLGVVGLTSMAFRRPLDRIAGAAVRRHPSLAASLIGAAIFCSIILAVEGFFLSRLAFRARASEAVYSPPRFQPGAVAAASLRVRGRTIYDVTYSLDESYRRITPGPTAVTADKTVLFFGGSFTFGEGVADEETLPSAVAARAPGWRIVNGGFPGHGPQQMLRQLEDGSILQALDEQEVKLVYVFIPGHVRRAIGAMRVASAWGRDYPYYSIDDEDQLVYRGTFSSGRPFISRLYWLLSREAILKYYAVDFPLGIKEGHILLAVRMMAESRGLFAKHFNGGDFYVAIYPAHPKDEFDGTRLVPFLEERGVISLDYTGLFDKGEGYWLEHDLHPTAKAHALLGQRLAQDLGIAGGGT